MIKKASNIIWSPHKKQFGGQTRDDLKCQEWRQWSHPEDIYKMIKVMQYTISLQYHLSHTHNKKEFNHHTKELATYFLWLQCLFFDFFYIGVPSMLCYYIIWNIFLIQLIYNSIFLFLELTYWMTFYELRLSRNKTESIQLPQINQIINVKIWMNSIWHKLKKFFFIRAHLHSIWWNTGFVPQSFWSIIFPLY